MKISSPLGFCYGCFIIIPRTARSRLSRLLAKFGQYIVLDLDQPKLFFTSLELTQIVQNDSLFVHFYSIVKTALFYFRRHLILTLLELTYLDTRPVTDKVR